MFKQHFSKSITHGNSMSDTQSEYEIVTPKPGPLLLAERKDPEKKQEIKSMAIALSGVGMLSGRSVKHNVNLPPQINSTITVSTRIRYTAGSDNVVSVSAQDLAGACGGICTVTNSVFRPWASSFRIKKLVAWPAASASVLNTVQLSWNSGIAGANRDVESSTDLPEGITNTTACVFVPPPKSLASDWFTATTGSTNIFTLVCTSGSVLDLYLDYTLANQFVSGTSTIATGTLGSIYYLPLDGASSHQYFPLHLPTTF